MQLIINNNKLNKHYEKVLKINNRVPINNMKFQDSNFFVFTHLCKINEKYSQVKVGTSSKNKKTHALSAATGVPPLFNLAKCRHCY